MTAKLYPHPDIRRSKAGRFFDIVFFPIRALFMGPRGYLGLSSLRDERMRAVAGFCHGKVLDIGCGPENLFISKFIGTENGVGIDVYPYEGVPCVVDDPTRLPFDSGAFDTVTLIAVGGHIPKEKRVAEFQEIARILKPGGYLVMTEGEPVTQWLVHVWWHFWLGLQGKVDIDHERGMEEEEEYCMPRAELLSYLNTAPLHLIKRRGFMWGLNNVYVAERN